jgi:Uma2 family endonuclease
MRMNIAITNAAEGLPRRAFTVDDICRMVEAGVIREDENIELIEGDVVMMAAKGFAHEWVKNELNLAISRALPPNLTLGIENSLQLADNVLVEPDIAVISRAGFKKDPNGLTRPSPGHLLLVVEIAVSSLGYDRGLKARIYARHGVREFWVIEAAERRTWVHTQPSGDAWSSIIERGPDDPLTTPTLPRFSLRLADV